MYSLKRLSAGLLACFMPLLACAQMWLAPADVRQWQTLFEAVDQKNHSRLMVGDLDGYVAAVRKAVKADDWVSQYVAGDLLYRTSPAAAIPFHEAASKLAPNEVAPQLELAFDYQRTGQCDRAIAAWQAADKRHAVQGPNTAVAAYCYFRVGRVDEALALWSRVQWPADRMALDFMLSDMAVGTQALDTHIKAYGQARSGDDKALKTLIANALDWRVNWWNAGMNREALDAVRALVKETRPTNTQLQRELECANDASTAKTANTVQEVMRRCHFWIEDGELPASSEVAKFMLARLDAVKPAADWLTRFGPALDQRARSDQGDLAALEILANLQAKAKDRAGLKVTDELGWHRYHVAASASSRVEAARADKEEWSAQGEAMLKRALVDFPDYAPLHQLRFELLRPAPADRERFFREWILAEYAGPPAKVSGAGLPSSLTLFTMVYTLRTLRDKPAAALGI